MKVSELTPSQLDTLTKFLSENTSLDRIEIDKVLAWFDYQELEVSALKYSEMNDNILSINSEEYLILDDSEADDMNDEYLDEFIDDVILREIPKMYQRYFDSDKWKDDVKYDGRGNILATYDGQEHGLSNGYYAYRVG
jgi:hypothetical protein